MTLPASRRTTIAAKQPHSCRRYFCLYSQDPKNRTETHAIALRRSRNNRGWRQVRKTSANPDTSGACTGSRALAAAFVRSGRFEFGTVGSVWAAGGQERRGTVL